jgi:Tol biopolymer transport system component
MEKMEKKIDLLKSLSRILGVTAGVLAGVSFLGVNGFFPASVARAGSTGVKIMGDRQLTNSPDDDFIPNWSPDGSTLAFTSYRSGGEEIWVMDANGKNAKQLTHNNNGDWSPFWRPDGQWIAFTSDRTGLNQLWLMKPDGSEQHALTSSPAGSSVWNRDPSWSPDGTLLIFTSNRSGKDENWIMEVASQKVWRQSNGMAEHWHPSFSPDGKKVLFSSNLSGEWGLWLSDLHGGNLVRMVPERRFDNNPAASWSPDGTKIVFRTATADLWIMNSDGTGAMPLTRDGKVDGWRSSWSPDGHQIAYTASRNKSGNSDVWVLSIE